MSDYERYGDYNRGEEDEDEGPPKPRAWVIAARIIRAVLILMLAGVILVLGFRMAVSHYDPAFARSLYATDALSRYVGASGIPAFETQKIRVPFESSETGYFAADNLILSRSAGTLQLSIRINRAAVGEIGAAFGVPDFVPTPDAFRFTLEDHLAYAATHPDAEGAADLTEPVDPAQHRWQATYVAVEKQLFYYYVKICFDGVDFTDVRWMRLLIDLTGAGERAGEPAAICVYENHAEYNTFRAYTLNRKERELF